METQSRRQFSQQALGSLLTFSVLETLFAGDLFADEVKPVTADWLARLNELSRDMKGQKLDQNAWQEQVETLLAKVSLPDLLKFVDFDKLAKEVKFRDRGERSIRPTFPKVEGLPTNLVYGRQIFALKKDRSVVPHGHNNMATLFYILDGEFHGRHYDRLEDEKDAMIVRPTIDRKFEPAEYSTVTDFKDNVHWFKATSERGFIFNIHVLGVDPKAIFRTGRVYIDPAGEKISGDRMRCRRINSSEAYRLYG